MLRIRATQLGEAMKRSIIIAACAAIALLVTSGSAHACGLDASVVPARAQLVVHVGSMDHGFGDLGKKAIKKNIPEEKNGQIKVKSVL